MHEEEIQIITAQQWQFVTKEWSGMEDKKTQLQKGLNWLAAGMPEIAGLPVKEGSFPWWGDKEQPQHCLVVILEWECSGATFGKQSWCWGMDPRPGWASPYNTHKISAGVSVYKELAPDAAFQTLCRTAYNGRTQCNALFLFCFIF